MDGSSKKFSLSGYWNDISTQSPKIDLGLTSDSFDCNAHEETSKRPRTLLKQSRDLLYQQSTKNRHETSISKIQSWHTWMLDMDDSFKLVNNVSTKLTLRSFWVHRSHQDLELNYLIADPTKILIERSMSVPLRQFWTDLAHCFDNINSTDFTEGSLVTLLKMLQRQFVNAIDASKTVNRLWISLILPSSGLNLIDLFSHMHLPQSVVLAGVWLDLWLLGSSQSTDVFLEMMEPSQILERSSSLETLTGSRMEIRDHFTNVILSRHSRTKIDFRSSRVSSYRWS